MQPAVVGNNNPVAPVGNNPVAPAAPAVNNPGAAVARLVAPPAAGRFQQALALGTRFGKPILLNKVTWLTAIVSHVFMRNYPVATVLVAAAAGGLYAWTTSPDRAKLLKEQQNEQKFQQAINALAKPTFVENANNKIEDKQFPLDKHVVILPEKKDGKVSRYLSVGIRIASFKETRDLQEACEKGDSKAIKAALAANRKIVVVQRKEDKVKITHGKHTVKKTLAEFAKMDRAELINPDANKPKYQLRSKIEEMELAHGLELDAAWNRRDTVPQTEAQLESEFQNYVMKNFVAEGDRVEWTLAQNVANKNGSGMYQFAEAHFPLDKCVAVQKDDQGNWKAVGLRLGTAKPSSDPNSNVKFLTIERSGASMLLSIPAESRANYIMKFEEFIKLRKEEIHAGKTEVGYQLMSQAKQALLHHNYLAQENTNLVAAAQAAAARARMNIMR